MRFIKDGSNSTFNIFELCKKLILTLGAGVDDVGHHHERLHAVLVPVFRAGLGSSVHEPPDGLTGHSSLAVVAFPLARIRKQFPQSRHLRHDQQGLPVALQGDPLPQVQVAQLGHEGGFLPVAVRKCGQQNGPGVGRWCHPIICNRLSLKKISKQI